MELGCRSRVDCFVAELFLNSCFSDTVFLTLYRSNSSQRGPHLLNVVVLGVAGSPPP